MMRTENPPPPAAVRREDYRPPDWWVDTVELDFRLDPERTEVRAKLEVRRNGDHDRPLVLDGDALELLAVSVDGRAVERRAEGARAIVPVETERAVVETVSAIHPAKNTQLMGLYASGGLLCTQCEAEGFRRITPFPDRPDVLARYRVRLEADAARYPVLLANGDRVDAGELAGGRHFAVFDDPFPKPSYLFAAVAGRLWAREDRFTTRSGRDIRLAIWTAEADLPRSAHAMAALKLAMRWDEDVYGLEYDLGEFHIVAVDDFNFGAMENKGLNIFNSRYVLADAETATDADFDAITAVIAHEYFHNWTGNRVTCRDWFQLALKEGLTVFRDQQFSADQGSAAVKRIEDVRSLRASQFAEDAGPLAHPVRPDSYMEIGNFYTATVYNKGAEVVRMLRTLLGAAAFGAGIDRYLTQHDGRAATIEEFVAAMEAASGRDLGQFRRWYSQAGTPRVTAELQGETLRLTQATPPTPGQPDKAPVVIPLRAALFDRATGGRIGDERLIELTGAEVSVRWPGAPADALLSINRGFSSPVNLEVARPRGDLALLAAHDDEPFARYEALQQLMRDVLLAAVKGDGGGLREVVTAVAAALDGDDPAFIAEAVLLPSEAMLGDAMAAVDVDGIHRARERLRRALGETLAGQWWRCVRASAESDLSPDAKGVRRLRGVALGYLMAADEARTAPAALAMFGEAANMTDRMAALAALASSRAGERDEALALFRARFEHEANVIDKWFGVQALSTRPDTLETVRRLSEHRLFHDPNPNRLRALVGAFAANQVRFHREDGAGYRFLADQVIAADRVNPQPAARLMQALGRWRRFDEGRAALMRSELERILAATPSRDVDEIARKSLG